MAIKASIALVSLITGITLAATPVLGAEPTEDMRTFARMFAALEARDVKGYCAAMHGASYTGYLNRVCQSAVQNKTKKPEDCLQESIAQQVKIDSQKCLVMPAAEFEITVQRFPVAREKFIKDVKAKGIDGEKLLQEERVKLR